jgi:phosphoglycolate phosphatase
MVSLAYGLSPDHESFDGYLTRFLDFYEARIPETRAGLYDGVEELLTHLEECGMNWGIVTNKSSRFTLPLLKQFPVLNTTEIVVCADHVTLPKPDPEGLIKACDLGQCQTSEAVYVGDHPRDIEAARNAGMKSVAVSWGYLPESPPLSHWQADSIAEHCDALLNILKTL